MLTTTARPSPPGTPRRSPSGAAPVDPRFTLPSDAWATLALAALTASSIVGFSRIFASHTWIGPALVTLAGVHLLSWALRRWHVPLTAAVLLGLAAVWLLSVWTVLGPYTHIGIPGPGTWSHFTAALRQARTDISATSAPVPATPGFRLLAALGAGLVAVLGDAIAFRWRYVLLGTAPAFALFVVCCTSGQGRGRGLVIGAFVAGVLLYVLAQRAPGGATAQVWFGGVRSGAGAWTLRAGVVVGAAAVVASVLVAPLMHGEDGVGALGWRSGLGPGGGGTRTVANPIVDLQTRLIQLSNTPVFTVQSSVPSYWRLTSLDTYTGSTWVSTGSYRGFRNTLPGTRPLGTRQIQDHFTINQLDSVWLPSAFNPIKVDGVRDVTYDPNSNSLITSQPSSDGLSYTVTSYQYLSTLNAADLRAAPSSFSVPSEYSSLPDTIPSAVRALAQSLTAGKTTEYDKALAIQNYLLSSRFHYNLQPPMDGSGNDAIANFLFLTRQGYCQQFAGAFAVLARLAGLPTRLAVGFATGTLQNGAYHVTDAQAHTWPEVYFGSQYGWIPFEPTPGFTAPGTSGYESSVEANKSNQPTPTPTTTPSSPTTTIGPKSGQNQHHSTPTTVAHSGAGAAGSKGGGTGWWVALALVGVGVIWLGVNVGWRRLRWAWRRRRSRSRGAGAEVLASWEDADEVMTWVGLGRRPSETFDEYARRAKERMAWMSTDDALPTALTRLAALAGVAAFAPSVPAAAPDEARSLAGSIRAGTFRAASFRRRLVWAFVPRPGYRP